MFKTFHSTKAFSPTVLSKTDVKDKERRASSNVDNNADGQDDLTKNEGTRNTNHEETRTLLSAQFRVESPIGSCYSYRK